VDPLGRVIDTISDLGLAPRAELERQLAAWREDQASDLSKIADDEPGALLRFLCERRVINAAQLRALSTMLAPARPMHSDPVIGQQFGGYVAQAKIGEGGTARVYRAAPLGGQDSNFVIKLFVTPEDPLALRRLRREGQLLASLGHPNIVRIHDQGETGHYQYLVLEYVDGPTLQELSERRHSFPWESATRAVRQIASALEAAHGMGIVHRDVKPHNVLVSKNGTLKLCDFGLAKILRGGDMASRAGEILGSPAYIAPEQWGDHAVDHRVDLFALGVIYYLLLTGVTPFRGRTPAEYALRIQAGDYVPIEGFTPDVPPGVRHVVNQLLERDRKYRTPSASALSLDVMQLLRGHPPDVPRLEGQEGYVALVGAATFAVGSAPEAQVPLRHPGVAPRHALLERTGAGLLLRVLEPAANVTRVNGQRAMIDVIVKEGDLLELGQAPAVAYREGNLRQAGTAGVDIKSSGEFEALPPAPWQPPLPVPGALVAALEDAGHPLALLACIEALDPETGQARIVASRRRLLQAGLALDVADRAVQRAGYLWRQRADWMADRLFQATHENLGHDVEAWLSWRFDQRDGVGPQVCARGPRARARLDIGNQSGSLRVAELDGEEEWTLGRSFKTGISVPDPSVSRAHVRLVRLVTRFAFQDLGSRMGVRVGGQRRDVGLLKHGDVLELGRVHVAFQEVTDDEPPATGPLPIDRATFAALVELRSPLTIAALVSLLDAAALGRACQDGAVAAGIDSPLEPALSAFLGTHRAMALEALPAITRKNFGPDAAAWRQWLASAGQLPPQCAPAGWSA
jgi:pSer/pThr/pTyr-binding forkhead associated (FHA) protein